MSGPLTAAVVATATAAGLMGGVFYAFSSFVMPGLRRLPAGDAVTAMQTVNDRAPRGVGVPLVGAAVGSLALAGHAVLTEDRAGSELRLVGSCLYLVSFVLTAAYHVPRNTALDGVDAAGPGAAAAWQRYAPGWCRWNHVRSLTAVAAAAVLTASLAA